MILRLSNAVSRGLLLAIAGVLAAVLSFFSIRAALAAGAADLGTRAGLQRATRLEPANARYWYLLGRHAQYSIDQQDSQLAIHAYRTALALNPGAADTLLELGSAYELEGNLPAARDAFVRAKKAYPASADVSWRYGNFLLRQGKLQAAFAEIRLAVQTDPKRAAEAFSRCYRANPDADFILDQALPASQEGYVDIIWDLTNDRQTALAMKVWSRLAALHPHLTIRDLYPLPDRLFEEGQYAEARRIWDQGASFADLPPLFQPAGSVIWDGGFESGVSGRGFAWQFSSIFEGVQTSFDSIEKHSGNRSLRLSFDGKHNVNFNNACTQAVVQPGTTYLFSAWVHTRALTSSQGVGFGLGSPGAPLLRTSEVHGSEPWTKIAVPWTAANNAHLAEICVRREPSDQPESRIQGTAWVDDVSLIPQTPERAQP